jgi:hypothetical protein
MPKRQIISNSIMQKPNLNEQCSKHFRYQDVIEAGETFERLRVDNVPQQLETYFAIKDLAICLLDPLIDKFGAMKITYGFCSCKLSNKIKARIAPSIDQHSSFELNTKSKRICKRDGIAVDFFMTQYANDMNLVADWVINNLPFDRLYFYGKDRPIHLSYSKNPVQKAYKFFITDLGLRVPRSYKN